MNGTRVGNRGGYGGYSSGIYNTENANAVIYIVSGGVGGANSAVNNTDGAIGGYNGGGDGGSGEAKSSSCGYSHGGAGGGATHIATKTGVLSVLSSFKTDILVVAGGGGGAAVECTTSSNARYYGGDGGGYEGSNSPDSDTQWAGQPGTQTAGGTIGTGVGGSCFSTYRTNGGFGYGGEAACGGGGGGSGFYGASGASWRAGTGGSGFINTNKLTQAYMYMYQNTDNNGNNTCKESSNAATKTTCTTNTGAHISQYANTGNGYAKITYLGTSI